MGYLVFFLGILSFVVIFGPLIQAESSYRYDQLVGVKHTVPKVITSSDQSQTATGSASFGEIEVSPNTITPVSTDFGIVIEKINANAKVVANVDAANEKAYTKALSEGVAHAAGTNLPGEKGNIFLFSHSTNAPWNTIRLNAIFYLLRELEAGDRVLIFYHGRRYDYIVYDKSVVSGNDISFLTNRYDQSVLTLQTCDPPGTILNRLIIRAKLQSS